MKYQGKLSNWNDAKGFGFVQPNGGGQRAFVHISAFKRRSRRPVDGDIIAYEVVQQTDGKAKAVNIAFIADHKSRHTNKPKARRSSGSSKPAILITLAFCIALVVLTILRIIPGELMFIYAGASLLAFLMYAWDKSAAQNTAGEDPKLTCSSLLCSVAGLAPI